VVQRGQSDFVLEDRTMAARPGDVLFVPAGATHRFENFSPDFATWVMFYGPPGGEVA
jgi:mannose-6-phosphate isomerase-like protein (cupin superfamily)